MSHYVKAVPTDADYTRVIETIGEVEPDLFIAGNQANSGCTQVVEKVSTPLSCNSQ